MHVRKIRVIALAATAFTALGAAPAWAGDRTPNRAADDPAAKAPAADDPAGAPQVQDDGEILVTARRREERLQDVPVAITAVAGETLGAQHIYRVADFAAKLPNFAAVQQNTRVSGLYVRGLGGQRQQRRRGIGRRPDRRQRVLHHVGFSWLDFVDLDHIELVRGPQGTLLGKNTTIGALIVTTKRPGFTPELNLEAGYGSRNRFQIRANATGPLIGDTLAYRATFYVDKSEGWARNAYDGEKFLDINRWAARGQLLFQSGPGHQPADRRALRDQRVQTISIRPSPMLRASPTARRAPPPGIPSCARSSATRRTTMSATMRTSTRRTRSKARSTARRTSSPSISAAPTLTAVTAWRQLRFRPRNDSDETSLSIVRSGYDVDVDQYSQEIRIASPDHVPLEYQFGGYFLREDLVSNNRTIFQSDATRYLLTGSLPAALPAARDSRRRRV
ncbi:MAG: TonB-dependent receptor plug domain-containing protein [Sphingomonas sp.]